MIQRPVRPAATFYRVHSPRWARTPLSGAGAARHGGRFNRPGLRALYLSGDPMTALLEYQQDDVLLPPGTLVTYTVTLARIVDLSGGYIDGLWSPQWAEWRCDWRALALVAKVEPPSWALGDRALASGATGILFPSTRQSGSEALNLVIYVDHLGASDAVSYHDPGGTLGGAEEGA